MFDYIVKRVRERTQGWHSKYLSEGGKEVLLKSIALAMPTYAMSCFKIPLTLCHEIDSILSQFWWGSDDSKRKISWVAWKRLRYTKKEGGLGFRDIEKFNDALLAKQAWRLLKNPNGLLSRVLQSRYYSDGNILSASLRRQPSLGWRSILHGRDLLIQGLRYRIGNGIDINPTLHPWIPSHPPRPATNHNLDPSVRICDLWDSTSKRWDNAKLQQFLSPEDSALAKRIYIPRSPVSDEWIWHYTKDGTYSVKSGYWLSTHLPEPAATGILPPTGSIVLKARIWKSSIPPKLKHFFWRVLSGAIGTATELNRRGIPIDNTCQRCNSAPESINHLLFECPLSISVWRQSNTIFSGSQAQTNSLEKNIEILLSKYDISTSKMLQHLPFWICWQLWKSRNALIFNKESWSTEEVLDKVNDSVDDWLSAVSSNHHIQDTQNATGRNENSWRPPPSEFVKVNIDGSCQITNQFVGVGWVIRDHQGTFLLAGSARLQQASSPIEAEALAVLHAIKSASHRGYQKIIIESDCKSVYDAITPPSIFASIDNIILDIHSWVNKFLEVRFSLVSRESNQVADRLAKLAYIHSVTSQEFFFPPTCLRSLLYNDSGQIQ